MSYFLLDEKLDIGLHTSVGRDVESVLKARTEMSDIDLEQWVRESYREKKGFIRQ